MTDIQEVFGTKLVVEHCPNADWYSTASVIEDLQTLLNQPEFNGTVPEQQGQARSTVINLARGQIAHRPCLSNLMQWIQQTVWNHRTTFGHSHARSVALGRNWVNEMQQGCSGILHEHYSYVAVFYVRLPPDGAQMQFVKDNETIVAQAVEGDLLIHEPNLWHSVTEHRSAVSRICLVLEFQYFD